MTIFLDSFGGVFDNYDDVLLGEISCEALHKLYQHLRPPGIRRSQVKAAIESIYSVGVDTLERADFEQCLAELDRRYFLLQDLVWEFKVLARSDGLLAETDTLVLFKATHENNFSHLKYQKWLKNRVVRGSGVPFNEIDVLLCNRPTPDDIIAELPGIIRHQSQQSTDRDGTDKGKLQDKKKKQEKLSYLKKLQALKAKRSENLNRRKGIRDEFEVNKQEAEDKRKTEERTEAERQHREAEEERIRKEGEMIRQKEQQQADEERRLAEEEKKIADEERRLAEEEKKLAEEEKKLADEERKLADEERRLAEEKTRLAEEEKRREEEKERQKEEDDRRKQEEEENLRMEEERKRVEKEREEEEEKLKQKNEAEAAAKEADRQALEEMEKESDKATKNLMMCQREEELANRDSKYAEELLKRAKLEEDSNKIEEAQRQKRESERRITRAKINKKLAEAIQSRELRVLEPAIKDAKAKKIEGTEEKIKEAEELVKLLYAALHLDNATRDRQIEEIEAALRKIKDSNYEKLLAKEVIEAEHLLKKLKRLEFLKRQVMELKQQTIAELKSYSKPPAVVKHVMTTTFLILGHNAKELKQWPQLVVLMGKTGKESLKRRVQQYEPDNLDWEVAEICKNIIVGMDTGLVADVSAGAAAFFVWCDGMVEERLSLPKNIPKELKDERRASLDRAEANKSLMRGGTVEVISRRSRSRDKIDAPKNKPNRATSSSRSSGGAGKSSSKSPAPSRTRRR